MEKPMTTRGTKELMTTDQQFLERYGTTPRVFVSSCLLPSLLAVRTVSCFYGGVLVETREVPAWKARLRALRTVLALGDIHEIEEKRIKIPLGAVAPERLAAIVDGFLETDWRWINGDFLVRECLKPCLDAVSTGSFFYCGHQVDSFQFQDWDAQLEAVTIAAKLRKLFPNELDNIHFATYRDIAFLVSEARRKCRAIQVVRQDQIVHWR